jgi:peptidoglycan L-alanyl-D-glutamate endopeptidase CwlK
VDFGISEGHRTKLLQLEYYQAGKSKCDGIHTISNHNYMPSLALDFYAFVGGKACYHPETLTYLAGLFHGVAEMLLAQGEITHRLRWGGNWDQDGEILMDQVFDDRPHIELIPAA